MKKVIILIFIFVASCKTNYVTDQFISDKLFILNRILSNPDTLTILSKDTNQVSQYFQLIDKNNYFVYKIIKNLKSDSIIINHNYLVETKSGSFYENDNKYLYIFFTVYDQNKKRLYAIDFNNKEENWKIDLFVMCEPRNFK